jgi:hypothetical protein
MTQSANSARHWAEGPAGRPLDGASKQLVLEFGMAAGLSNSRVG